MSRTLTTNRTPAAGYIYILENNLLPDIVKIGRSWNAEERAKTLSRQTGTVGEYNVYWKFYVGDDCNAVERALHYKFRQYRFNKETFKIDKALAKKEAVKFLKAIAPLKNIQQEAIKDAQNNKAPKHLIIKARQRLWQVIMLRNKHDFIKDAINMCLKEGRIGQPVYNRVSALRSNGFTQMGRIDLYVLKEHLRLVVTTKNSENSRMIIKNMIGKQVEIKTWEGGVSFFIRNKQEYAYLKSWLSLGKKPARISTT